MIKIPGKITSVGLKAEPSPDKMHEGISRPEVVSGKTYKVKIPNEDSALYVTINDITLNPGTPYEEVRPFEMFINSRNTAHRQWIDTLTRVISAVFRKGGEIGFLAEEMKVISDPNGGGWHKGRFVKSIVSEIGYVLEQHINEPKVTFPNIVRVPTQTVVFDDTALAGASKCKACGEKAVVPKDGCPTCLSCGDSKCG